MRIIIILISCLLSCIACKDPHSHDNPSLLVSYKDKQLFREEVEQIVPDGLNKEDSLLYSQQYIDHWINDALLYEIARNNISNSEEINSMVEHYRRSLIIYQYQQQLINQQVLPTLTETEITDYYEQSKHSFILNENIISGLFIKVPINAPSLNELRKWYCDSTAKAVEKIEKYSIQNAVDYNYFYDQWIPFADMLDQIPYEINNETTYLQNNNRIETKDSLYHYFLYIHKYKLSGNRAPLLTPIRQSKRP